MKKITHFVLTCLILFGFGSGIVASSAHAADDYDFSWLDPEKKIYVLQNRKFRKAGGVQLSVLGGMGISEAYRQALQVQPRLGFWFNEDFGLEAFYTSRFNSTNGTYKAFENAIGGAVGVSPYIREIDSQLGVLFNWAPWYSKINVFNSILYFDWYFSFGLGTMSTQIGEKTKETATVAWKPDNLFAIYLGTGQVFHVSERFSVRLDLLGHFYSAEIYGGKPGAPTDKALFSNSSVNLGIGFKL